LIAGQLTAAHRLTADEHFPHPETVTVHTDKSPKLKRLRHFAACRRNWFSFGAGTRSGHGAAAGQRPPERQFVGEFEVAAHRQA
jgi:hypothetical protein